jgi:two-component system, OmpR family, KDP operon response regulator KdpE
MKIVIIEDEVELGHLIQNYLKRKFQNNNSSNTIKTATTIKDGMHWINEIQPDWVFLDNNLPDGKGINIIEDIKSMRPSVIIMMSAMSNIREEAIRRGVDYFIDKPISFVAIQTIINESGFSANSGGQA